MKEQTILVAGASGYLGSRLVSHLHASDYPVLAGVRSSSHLDRLGSLKSHIGKVYLDTSLEALSESLRESRIDTIINCMTDYGRSSRSESRVLQANLIAPHQLMLAASEAKVATFINAHTSLPASVNSYSLAKHQFSQWLSLNDRLPKRINLAIEQFYGPDESSDRFVAWLIQQFTNGTKQLELTAGEQQRDFVHVDDVVAAISLIVERREEFAAGFHELSVGCGHSSSIREMVELIQALCNNQTTQLVFGAVPYRENESMLSCTDNSKLTQLGWRPEVPLDIGLRACIESQQTARLAA